jgi:hypothetical protein
MKKAKAFVKDGMDSNVQLIDTTRQSCSGKDRKEKANDRLADIGGRHPLQGKDITSKR